MVLDVGPDETEADDADLAVFVDRLAAAGSDPSTALARAQIRRVIEQGMFPPGTRKLAEALAASVTDRTPSPRRSADDSGSVVGAMRDNALVVLEDFDAEAVAGAVGALLADGRRIVVTGPTGPGLDAVRAALPPHVGGRVLDQLPGLPSGELRELRGLLATSTPARRARSHQQLPVGSELPHAVEVADLCGRVTRPTGPGPAVRTIPGLLGELDPSRRAAVTSVARLVHRSLAALAPRSEYEWAWTILSDLILTRHRAVFDRMLEDTAQAVDGLEQARNAPPVSFATPAPPEALALLRRYRDFLAGGGRSRSYFRSTIQREVQPVLDTVTVEGRAPVTEADVQQVVSHLELGERLRRVDTGCAEMELPAPRNESELFELTDGLVKVAAAVRSVGALRHDVLFLAPDSPLSVPDLESAAQVAHAILDYELHGCANEAARKLDAMADRLAGSCPVTAMAPEHERAVAALRERDAAAYIAAADAFIAARREVRDEARRRALLKRLGESAPGLAEAWTALADSEPAALGVISFVPMDTLLSAVPPPDSADVVLVLGAPTLGVEHLLLTAVAPRLIAVVGPGEQPGGSPTLLSVLQRAAVLVIRGRATAEAQVLPISAAQARTTKAAVS